MELSDIVKEVKPDYKAGVKAELSRYEAALKELYEEA